MPKHEKDEEVTLETVSEQVGKMPTKTAQNKMARMLAHLVWAVQQLGEKMELSLSREDYDAAVKEEKDAKPKKDSKGLTKYRRYRDLIKADMEKDGAEPTNAEVTTEYNRRKAAGELPELPDLPEDEAEAAAPAAKSAAKPAKAAGGGKSAAKPAKSAAKPAAGGKPAGKAPKAAGK